MKIELPAFGFAEDLLRDYRARQAEAEKAAAAETVPERTKSAGSCDLQKNHLSPHNPNYRLNYRPRK